MVYCLFALQSKEVGKGQKDQESLQSSTIPDPGHHMEKRKKTIKTSHIREQRGQPFPNRLPQGCKEQIRQYDKDKHE